MCFAYFKMNELEKNPKKYMKNKCSFLLEKGFLFKCSNCNAELGAHFYTNNKRGYCYYINRMGANLIEDDLIFNKKHLSNYKFDKKDFRAGEYF